MSSESGYARLSLFTSLREAPHPFDLGAMGACCGLFPAFFLLTVGLPACSLRIVQMRQVVVAEQHVPLGREGQLGQ